METGVVIIQEPVFTTTSVEDASAGDHSTMEVDKVNLSPALDDCRNSIIPEVVNGSGYIETEESKHEKEEAMKTISVVEDSKIVKEKASETETDEQGTTFVHEPESFNKSTNDANIILSDVTLEKEKEDDTTQKLEEVVFEKPVTETKDSQEQETDIGNTSIPVKSSEDDDIEKIFLDSAREEIPIKTDEVKDSRTVENSVNGTETEHSATVSVEEISRNGENIVKETSLEEEASTDGVSLHDVETTKGVLLEAEKEAEPKLDAKERDETETVKDPEIIHNEETTVHESISLKENAEPVEAIKNSDDEEKIPREVTVDREKEEDILQNSEEVQESLTVIETPKIQGEDLESKATNDTEEDEHVFVRDIPQDETNLIPKAETVNTSTVQETAILRTLDTTSDETDAEPSLDLKQEEKTVKTVTSSDEVQERVLVIEPPETSTDQRSKDTEEDENVLGRNMPHGEIFVTEAESLVTKEVTEPIMDLKEDKEQNKAEKSEEIPSDLALKVDKEELKEDNLKVDQVAGAHTMEEQRDPELNEPEAEGNDHNRTEETEKISVEKLVAHPHVKSVEQIEKRSLESPSEVSEEKIRNLDEKIEEKQEEEEEEVPPHQESQEEGSYGSETVSVTESSELGEKSQEERSQPIDQDKEMKLQKDQIHKHEPANEAVTSDEVIKASSASPSEEREGETIVDTTKIEEIKEIKVGDKIQRSLETVKPVDTEPVISIEDDIEESSSSTCEEIQIKSKDIEDVQIDETDEEKTSRTAETSVNGTEDKHKTTVSVEGISRNIVNETASEEDLQGEHAQPVEAIKNSDNAEKISHGVTGDREKEENITRKTEEVQESSTVIETLTLEEEHIESKDSKDTEEHEHVLVREIPQIDSLVTEAEDANTSTVQEAAILKTLETTSNEIEAGQETEPSLDLKEDKEKEEETETAKTVILSDEVIPSDQVDVQQVEYVEVESKETLQEKSNEEKKHDNLLDVLSGESEKFQVNEPETVLVAKTESQEDIPSDLVLKVDKEELKDDKTEVHKVDGTQVMVEQSGQELNEQDAEQIDRNKIDQAEEIPVENLVVESVERMQSSSLECPSEVSKETSTIVDEKIEEKLQEEEVTLHQEGQEKAPYGLEIKEETLSLPVSKDLGEKSQEEVSCLPKETEFQQEHIEKCEPTNEVPNDQQSPVEEKSDEVIQVSSASPSEEPEVVKLEDIKANEEEQIEEKIHKSLGTLDIAEPQILLPSYSEEQEHETVSEKIEDERVKEEEPFVQILSEDDATKSHERQDEIHKTGETTAVQEEQTRDIGSSLNEKCSVDQIKAEEQAMDAQEKVTLTEKVEAKANESEDDKVDEHVDSQTSLVFSEKSDGETLTAEEKKGDEETTVRDMPQGETIVTVADAVDTSTVQDVAVLSTLETNNNESEAVHRSIVGEEESQVTNEDTEPRMELKADKEQVERETVQTVILSNEVITDESQGREESVEVKPKEIVQHESTQEKDENLLDVPYEESAEKMKRTSLESPSEQSEETSKTVDEKIEEIPEGEVTLHQEIQETKEEKVPVPESRELGVQSREEESCPPNEQEKETALKKEQIEKHESTSEEDTNAHQIPVEEKSDEVSSASPSGETVVEAEKIEDIKENEEEEQVEDKIQRSIEAVETVEPHSSFPSPPEEHETIAEAEKIEDGKVKETDPMGDMSEKDLEISETKDQSPPFEASGSDGTESYELVAGFEEQKTKQVKLILEGDETKTEKLPSTETIPQETLFESLEAPKQEESKEDKSQEVSETIEAKGDHTLDIEPNQIPSFSSELEEKIPKQIEDIHDEETKKARVLVDQSLPVEVSQENQIPSLVSEQEEQNSKQVQEIHEEETNVSHKVEATSGRNLPVEASQAHQTPSSELVSGLDDKTSKEVEEIHEEKTKAHKLKEEEIIPTEIVPRESFSETPASMLAYGEDDQVTVQEGNVAGDTQEEKNGSEETEESVGVTKPKESEVERTDKSDDQIETSTKVIKVEDEDTKETDTDVAEITKGQSLSHAPENACLEKEELKDLGTLKPGAITEDQDSLKNGNSDDFTFSTETSEAEHGDETSSTLPVVGILKELQTTLEEKERAINDSEAESSGNDFHSIKEEPQPLEKNLVPDTSEPVTYEKQDEKVVEESPASEIMEANMLLQDESGETKTIQEENGLAGKSSPIEELKLQEEHREEGKVQDNITREFEVDVEERLQEETREIAECKEETLADLSLTEVVPGEKILIPSSSMPFEESKQEEGKTQEDINASAPENISLQEEHSRDFETSKKEQNIETHETLKEEDQIVDIKEETKNEELQVEKLSGLSARRDTEETFSLEVKKDQEDASELEVEHGSATLQVKKEEESHSVLGNDQEINEVVTSEKKVIKEAEHESNEGHIETQAISDHNDRDFPTEEAPKDQREDANADKPLTKEALEVQDQPKDFEAPVTDKDTTEQEKKSNELTYVQDTNVKPEVRDGHDSVAAQNEESGLIEEKNEVDYLKTEPEDAIKHGVSIEEKSDMFEKTVQEATKEIYQEESKQTDNVTAFKEVIKEEEKVTTEECFNSMKNNVDATEQSKPQIQETDTLSSVTETQDKSSKQEDEVPNQEKREMADEVPKLENVKIAEELQKQDGESDSNKEPEPTVKETARKSLSDLIQKGKGTDKTEVATTEPRIEEELKTEEEDEDGDEHKDDKTSPDSIVMVETKDTVSIIKTQKKSQGILSGVGSKVKHSISKVKKAFTGKSSHTTKPSSPQ